MFEKIRNLETSASSQLLIKPNKTETDSCAVMSL